MKNSKRKIKFRVKRIKMPRTIRMVTIAVLGIILLFSAFSTYAAYQKPTNTEESYTTLTYGQSGRYNYIVYLENNTVYNKSQLFPGEGIIFEQIVKNISASFSYEFQIDEIADIQGNYNIQAEIQTDLWTKTYTIVPSTSFNYSGKTSSFKENFPIDFQFYGDILTEINSETGITAPNPLLLIKSNIALSAKTTDNLITEFFSPSISVSLNKKTIEISEILSNSLYGSRTDTQTVFHQEVVDQRTNLTLISILFLVILLIFSIVTKGIIKTVSGTEKILKKIKKKYGEWLVETDKNPEYPLSKIISLGSLEDLSIVGEELGKPLIHYIPNPGRDDEHLFYVLDGEVIYRYALNMHKKIIKRIPCSECGTEITAVGRSGEKVEITCHKCLKKTIISMGKPEEKGLKSITSHLTHKKSGEI